MKIDIVATDFILGIYVDGKYYNHANDDQQLAEVLSEIFGTQIDFHCPDIGWFEQNDHTFPETLP